METGSTLTMCERVKPQGKEGFFKVKTFTVDKLSAVRDAACPGGHVDCFFFDPLATTDPDCVSAWDQSGLDLMIYPGMAEMNEDFQNVSKTRVVICLFSVGLHRIASGTLS